MTTILVLGAGRSSSSLIKYLLEIGATRDWHVKVGDVSEDAARQRVGYASNGSALKFEIHDETVAKTTIASADVVVSLLPANLHALVAKICLSLRKHFLNASYVSEEMKSMHTDALSRNLLFINECGLDPGIDHMSAMRVINAIKNDGGKLTSFESFTGGLIAPETDPENPWRYKFTWNPRNVVMAGQGTAKFLLHGEYKYIPYQQLFKRTTPVSVLGHQYEGYPNRDSLKYMSTYGLDNVETMIRGTLRNAGYCNAWNVLVQLGCCDDTYEMEGVERLTHRDFIKSFLMINNSSAIEETLCSALNISANGEEMRRLSWSGLFSNENIGLKKGTPAQILEHILNKKWKLSEGDKDFIVMWHRFGYTKDGAERKIQSYMTVKGDDEVQTAMAKTVGLPLGIACKLLLEGKIKDRGIVIPITQEIYQPVLNELKVLGIEVIEQEI
jgi:saccharopine dehydrogenase-like NADP-dependent oxidoreductase